MAKAVNKRRKGNTVTLDFEGVKSGGGAPPEGRYKAKIINVEQKEGQDSGEPYSELTWEITSEKCNGREVRFDNYSHQPQALWRLKSLLEALGVDVPDGDHEIDWEEFITDETECILELTHDKRDSGTYAKVTGWYTLDDAGGTVDDEAEEKPRDRGRTRTGGRSGSKDEEQEDDNPPSTKKKAKKGAEVKFKDEKNKVRKGVITKIDGDTAVVESGDDDFEMDIEELTVIG